MVQTELGPHGDGSWEHSSTSAKNLRISNNPEEPGDTSFHGCSANPLLTSTFDFLVCEAQLSIAWCKARRAGAEVAPRGVGACCVGRAHVKALIDIYSVENGHEAELASNPTKVMLPTQRFVSKKGSPSTDISQNTLHIGGAM